MDYTATSAKITADGITLNTSADKTLLNNQYLEANYSNSSSSVITTILDS